MEILALAKSGGGDGSKSRQAKQCQNTVAELVLLENSMSRAPVSKNLNEELQVKEAREPTASPILRLPNETLIEIIKESALRYKTLKSVRITCR